MKRRTKDNKESEITEEKVKYLISRKEVTVQEIKSIEGFENITDEQAKDIILSLRSFAALIFSFCAEKMKTDASKIIDINRNNNSSIIKKAA